jgi:2-isopropylmalate synthase
MATPNVYADQIEWMADHLTPREHIIISLHTHNDRGTSIASTELAQLAGADRVEGTLLSNGERTGNVDIITLALNLFTQGIDPKLDLSDVNKIVQTVEYVTEMLTHPRHPYVGALVYTAFSGSHQDAIKKGMDYRKSEQVDFWEVPYLPIDPTDVGRTYGDIIRINSQSGKGGMAAVLEDSYDYELPKAMYREVGKLIQKETDKLGLEIKKSRIKDIFEAHYLLNDTDDIVYKSYRILPNTSLDGLVECEITFTINGKEITKKDKGNGPLSAIKLAIVKYLHTDFTILSYKEHSREAGVLAEAIAYIQIESKNGNKNFGVGIDTDIVVATIKALFSAIKVGKISSVKNNEI